MSRKNPARAAKRTKSRLQAFLLLLLGLFCVLAAWLLHPNPYAYPVGILVLGLGMMLAATLNPYRLVIGGILAEHLTPGNFVPFMLSLWLPGIGLLLLGLIYVAVSMRV